MPRTKKVHEVVVILTSLQLRRLQEAYPEDWKFTRRLITWRCGGEDQVLKTGVPVKELLQDGDDLYVVPTEESGIAPWKL
ncbi:hypothetical protein IH575_03980 [Candidatus Dojkabacteria bacterium]|nr:hypothetical protein [Candidatus Dojkabacteria bacterium]